MATIRVKAAVVDTKKLLLYKEDGSTVSIPQGDPRIASLVQQILPAINAGAIVEIDLKIENQYRDFEEAQDESGGIVRFFRTARSKLGGIFRTEESAELPTGVFGEIPVVANLNTAIEEIIAHSQPVTQPEFSSADTQPHETIIAVVEDAQGETRVIPGVEALKDIFEHSAKHRHTKGVQALLKRMAGYISQRQHSVEDLLRFLEKGDLPIADDGCIIAYKSLYSRNENGETYFVDPHTQKVRQKVGSYVCVAEDLVDKNRRNECSNGLHIGRRAYMRGFSGNAMMLCKIAPEDVIVVPHGDPNKVRVCGYHILAQLPDKARSQIKENRPMTEIEGIGDLLAKVLAGNHVDILERVEIQGQLGEDVVITPTGKIRKLGKNRQKDTAPIDSALDDKRNAKPEQQPSRVNVKDVSAAVTGSRQQKASHLWMVLTTITNSPDVRIAAAKELLAFQKKVKIGWSRLGLTKEQVATAVNIANSPEKDLRAAAKAAMPKKAPKKPAKASKRSTAAPRPSNPAKVAEALVKDVPAPASKALTKTQYIRMLADQLEDPTLPPAGQAVVARQMLDFRRASKKSWESYQIEMSDERLKKIINAAPVNVPHGDGRYPGRPKNDPMEMSLPADKKEALRLVREGQTVSQASKATGVHRRTIDRLIGLYGNGK
jgi:hypothetical protein